MGLFSFLKKKESDVSAQKPFNLDSLNTDLPSIEGAKLGDELTLPSLDMPLGTSEDHAFSSQNTFNDELHNMPSEAGSYHDHSFNAIPEDVATDINQLFLSDPEWKEPDWEHYEPYYEENIDPPEMQDFGISPPQSIPSQSSDSDISLPAQKYEIPEFADVELKEHHVPDDVPYDVFVKGTDYSKVFLEMREVKDILITQDEKIGKIIDTFKQEESTITSCKENMDLLYKKMLMIDKKVFA